MKEELFAICEGAFNKQGQLTIVNTLDRLLVPSLPYRASFGVALKFLLEPSEEIDKKLSVAVLAPDNAKVFDPEFVTPIKIVANDNPGHYTIAVNFQNVLFVKPGIHNVRIELDGVHFDNRCFEVLEDRNGQ